MSTTVIEAPDALDREQEDLMQEREALGVVLGRLRAQRGMSQGRLARATGLDTSYVSRLETGERTSPPLRTLRRIAEALDASPRERVDLIEAAGFPIRGDR